ncbi:MAG: hypothetical protein HC794_06855 [Nitrospiraceae bacterium]|nr:hypothetical protein [Nitrospiraceae bacterium]
MTRDAQMTVIETTIVNYNPDLLHQIVAAAIGQAQVEQDQIRKTGLHLMSGLVEPAYPDDAEAWSTRAMRTPLPNSGSSSTSRMFMTPYWTAGG